MLGISLLTQKGIIYPLKQRLTLQRSLSLFVFRLFASGIAYEKLSLTRQLANEFMGEPLSLCVIGTTASCLVELNVLPVATRMGLS